MLYCDGSSNNPGPGGWGFILIDPSQMKSIKQQDHFVSVIGSGGLFKTTNNQMEYLSAIEGLNAIKTHLFYDKAEVIVYSDSQLLINSMTLWMGNWTKNNWKTSNGQ